MPTNSDNRHSATRCSVPSGTLVAACMTLWSLLGCRIPDPPCIPHKSIHELYGDAVLASQLTMRKPEPQSASAYCPDPVLLNEEQHWLDPDLVPPASPSAGEEIYLDPAEADSIPFLPPLDGEGDVTASGPLRSRGPVSQSSLQQRPNTSQIRQVSHLATEPLITEFLEDTDIRQALQAISSQAQVSLIVDEEVTGYVTATIEDATFESALKTLLMPLGLIYRKVSDKEYLVGLPDPETALFSRMSRRINFQPMHIPPTELIELLSEKEKAFVRAVDNRNYVLIQAPEEIASNIEQLLHSFDNPVPQVELEAIVCVVSPDQGFKSGLDWGHAVTLNGSELMRLGMQGLSFSGAASVAGASNAFADFAVTSAFVKLLAQEGYLAIRAAPRVTARDGDQAQIKITRESFFSTQPQSDNAFFRQDIQQVEAGIELDITPIVRGDNITMKIEKAEVSEDIRTSSINQDITENPFPSINRRTVSTTVHVKDGETIVIGGLVQRQTVDRIAQIPVLGKLPGIGRVFQTIEQTQQDAEVVIFISPKLVRPCQ